MESLSHLLVPVMPLHFAISVVPSGGVQAAVLLCTLHTYKAGASCGPGLYQFLIRNHVAMEWCNLDDGTMKRAKSKNGVDQLEESIWDERFYGNFFFGVYLSNWKLESAQASALKHEMEMLVLIIIFNKNWWQWNFKSYRILVAIIQWSLWNGT